MSANNGDKSRFHRLRKKKLQVRETMRAMRAKLSAKKEETAAK